MIRHISKILQSAALMALLAWGCGGGDKIVDPNGDTAQVRLNLEWPEASQPDGNRLSGAGVNRASVINEVTVSAVDATTRRTVVREEELTIRDTPEGRVAEGTITLPLVDDFQVYTIIVFATDAENLLFFLGVDGVALTRDQSEVPEVTIVMAPAIPISSAGTVSASSTFGDQQSQPQNAIDFDTGTSWFSDGSIDGNTSTFTWNAPAQNFIGTVGIVNNSTHDDPTVQSGFGFEQVTYKVFSGPNATGDEEFSETIDYPQSAALPVNRVSPLVRGQSVQLTLTGPQNSQRSGFSELLIVDPLFGGGGLPTVNSITVTPADTSVDIGETVDYTAVANFSNGTSVNITSQAEWASTNTTVATVSGSGRATAEDAGSTVISATFINVTGNADLRVLSPNAPMVSNLSDSLVEVNSCDLNDGGAPGSSFSLTLDFTDPDGDVGGGETKLTFNSAFGTFESTNFEIVGNGSQGSIRTGICIRFASTESLDVTVQLTDASGNISNGTNVVIQRPEGGNAPATTTAEVPSVRVW